MQPVPPGSLIKTERLILEPFQLSHAEAMNVMNADPEVMRYIGPVETLTETRNWIEDVLGRWAKFGYSWWSIFLRQNGDFIGAACVQHLANKDGAPLEIGWRLIPTYHGKGYATEAGQAAIDFAFGALGTDYLVAVADPDNEASQRVMQRLGMRYVGIEEHYDVPCAVYELHKTSAKKS